MFELPWVRLREYLHRCALYHGGNPVRDAPEWPQMHELKRLMTEKAEILKRNG